MKLTNRNNNVKKICRFYEWTKPTFIDSTTYGYRICLGRWDNYSEEVRNDFIKIIKENLDINVTLRKRNNPNRELLDMIVPYYEGDEAPMEWS